MQTSSPLALFKLMSKVNLSGIQNTKIIIITTFFFRICIW